MIGVLGSGSWATAIVKMLLEQPSARVCWYVREPDIRKSLSFKYGIAHLGKLKKYQISKLLLSKIGNAHPDVAVIQFFDPFV